MTKGTCQCDATQNVISKVNEEIYRDDEQVYWAWLSSERNFLGDSTTRLNKLHLLLDALPSVKFLRVGEEAIQWGRYLEKLKWLQSFNCLSQKEKKDVKKEKAELRRKRRKLSEAVGVGPKSE